MIFDITKNKRIVEIPIMQIRPCRNQARKYYNSESLRELAQSIKNNGILQPVTVRKVSSLEYELVAGERRLRAAVMCGNTKIPCIVITCSDDRAEVISLEENIQRSDLNFFEEAQGITSLMDSASLTRREAARRLSKNPSYIADRLSILRLDDHERDMILKAHLTEKHARALLRIEDKTDRRIALSEIIEKRLNVSQSESYVESFLCQTRFERRRSQRQKGVIRDIRLFENTIRKALFALETSGLSTEAKKCEGEDYVEYTVRVPKERTENCMTA